MKTELFEISGELPEGISEIEGECFESPWSEVALRVEASAGNCVFLAASQGGRLLAFVIVRVMADECEVYKVAVTAPARRQGIALALMEEALSRAKQLGAEKAYLEVRESNKAAAALYARLGFETVGLRKDYYDSPRENAVLMMKEV